MLHIFDTIFIFPIRWVLEHILEFFYAYTSNYGVSLIALSLAVSTLLLPIYAIADKWRNDDKKLQQKMKPDLDAIKKNYNGQERFYSIRVAHRIYGYHPIYALKVSLGFLIQIPFFFAAYSLLSHYEGWVGVGFGAIENLATPDKLLLGINVLPILMTIINMIAGLVYTKDADKKETIQLLGLSTVFLIVLYQSPSGLVLYWTLNNLYSLVKYIVINKLTFREILLRLKKILVQGLQHRYISNIVRVLLIASGYLIVNYALSTVRSSAIASATLRGGLGLLFLATLAMQLKLLLKRNNINKWLLLCSCGMAIGFMVCVTMLLYLLQNNLSAITIKNIAFSENRLQQICTVFLVFSAGLAYPNFTKISTPLYRFQKNLTIFPIKYARIVLISAIGIFVVASPLATYIASPNDYGGNIYVLLLIMAGLGLGLFFFGYLLLTIFFRLYRPMYNFLVVLLLWATFIAILYGFIIDLGLGVIIGQQFTFDSVLQEIDLAKILLEILFWLSLSALFVVYFAKIRIILTILITSMTILIVGNTLKTMLFSPKLFIIDAKEAPQVVSSSNQETKDLLPPYHKSIASFSRNKNILVFVLDAYPSDLFEEMLSEHPSFTKKLDGFTWYKNTVSVSPSTYGSVAALVAGHAYTANALSKNPQEKIPQTWELWPSILTQYHISYINAWRADNEALNKKFSDRNFRSVSLGSDYFDYWKSTHQDAQATQEVLKDEFHIIKLLNMSAFKVLSFQLKQKLYLDYDWSVFVTGSLGSLRYEINKYVHSFAGNLVPLDSLSTTSTVSLDEPTLKFIWNHTPHYPFFLNDSCDGVARQEILDGKQPIYAKSSALIPMRCSLEVIVNWISWMKEEGIYDKTKIIIASDHGSTDVMFDDDGKKFPNDNGIFAFLMVKDFDNTGNLDTSMQLMSNADIAAIIISSEPEINIPRIGADPTKFVDREPLVFYQKTSDSTFANNKLEILYTITIPKDVYNLESWKYTHNK